MWSVFSPALSVAKRIHKGFWSSQQSGWPAPLCDRRPMEVSCPWRPLLFEEVFEGLARVARARRRRCSGARGLRIRSGRGVFLDGHAKFVEPAIVAGILGRDALANGLRALELRASVEEAALLAAMQFELP